MLWIFSKLSGKINRVSESYHCFCVFARVCLQRLDSHDVLIKVLRGVEWDEEEVLRVVLRWGLVLLVVTVRLAASTSPGRLPVVHPHERAWEHHNLPPSNFGMTSCDLPCCTTYFIQSQDILLIYIIFRVTSDTCFNNQIQCTIKIIKYI